MTQRPAPLTRSTDRSTPWDTLSLMIESDAEPVFEIAARFALLTVFCLSVTIWLGVTATLFWLLVYAISVAANLWFLTSRRKPGTQRDLWIATLLAYLTTLCFTALPVYLWSLDIPLLRFAALSLVVSMVLYSITRFSGLRRMMIWDGILITALTLYFGYDMARQVDGAVAMALSMLFSVLLVLYYLVTLQKSVATRHQLKAVENRNIQARKMEAIGHLTGGIAHDFNNLLTVMIGNLDLYSEVSDRAEKDMLAGEARGAAMRAATLTAHLLAFSRKARLDPRPIDPERFLQSFITIVQRVLPGSITLQLELVSAPRRVTVDVHQLENALLNLVINARDAMDGSPGNIIIGLDWMAPPSGLGPDGVGLADGTYCRISVRDTGPGIAPELLATVMEPFYTTKPVGKGSGLGLPMVKGFVEQSGGALELASTQGSGTRIHIWLPSDPIPDPDPEEDEAGT